VARQFPLCKIRVSSRSPARESVGLVGLLLIFWALGTLGTSFGLAPADHGLVTGEPYRFIRHPMYLRVLVYQVAGLGINFNLFRIGLFLIFALLQVVRIQCEERS